MFVNYDVGYEGCGGTTIEYEQGESVFGLLFARMVGNILVPFVFD